MKTLFLLWTLIATSVSALATDPKNGVYKNPDLSCQYQVQMTEDKSTLFYQRTGNAFKCLRGEAPSLRYLFNKSDKIYSLVTPVSEAMRLYCISSATCYEIKKDDTEILVEWEFINDSAFIYRLIVHRASGNSEKI